MISIEDLKLVVLEFNKQKEQSPFVTINVKVNPCAKCTALIGVKEDRLVLSVKEPALENKANKAVVKLVSKSLKIPKSSISIITGQKSKMKTLKVFGDSKTIIQALANRLNQ